MELAPTYELVRLAAQAIARRDAKTLRTIIARLDGHISPRLMLLAVASAQALDAGDVVRALQFWDPFAEACCEVARSAAPL